MYHEKAGKDNVMRVEAYTKKNGDKCFRVKGYLGIDQYTGESVEITRQGFSSRKEAQLHFLNEQREFDARQKEGALLPPIKFKELAEQWFLVYERSVGESTFQKTTEYFNNHIYPALGDIYIDKINVPLLNRTVLGWSQKFQKASTVWTYVRRVLELGVSLGYLRENPGKTITVPKTTLTQRKKKSTLIFLEREELLEYMSAAKKYLDPMWYAYVRLLAMTGLRRGEALVLTGKDIDGNLLTVDKTLATGKNNRTYIGPPKTGPSYRTIRIDDETAKLLLDLVDGPDDFIFCKSDGNYWSLSRPDHYMTWLSKKTGVPKISPHVLRHTHCAMLFEAGAGIKEVQDRLGHKTIKITLEIYNHVSSRKRNEAVDRLNAYLEQ